MVALTYIFRGIPQSLQANALIVPWRKPLVVSSLILSPSQFPVILGNSEVDLDSLNILQTKLVHTVKTTEQDVNIFIM
jgi:hypothetical protein